MNKEIKFSLKAWNTLTMSNGCIATEVNPVNSSNRKWASIYPLKDNSGNLKFRYFEVELSKEIIEKDLDWFSDEEKTEEIFIDTIDDLYDLLDSRNLDPKDFDVPWKFNYPHHY